MKKGVSTLKPKKCIRCKILFIAKSHHKTQRFCSPRCSTEWLARGKSKQLKCRMCKKTFKKRLSYIEKHKRTYCSMKCSNDGYSKFHSGKNHYHWGKGMDTKEIQRHIRTRSELNHAIRDGSVIRKRCEICGLERSEGHHFSYNHPLTVLFLCRKHHMMAHKMVPVRDRSRKELENVTSVLRTEIQKRCDEINAIIKKGIV